MLVVVRGRCCPLLLYRPAARLVARLGEVLCTGSPTVCFSGRTYLQLGVLVRVLFAAAGRRCLPLVAAVAVTVAVSSVSCSWCNHVRRKGTPQAPRSWHRLPGVMPGKGGSR